MDNGRGIDRHRTRGGRQALYRGIANQQRAQGKQRKKAKFVWLASKEHWPQIDIEPREIIHVRFKALERQSQGSDCRAFEGCGQHRE